MTTPIVRVTFPLEASGKLPDPFPPVTTPLVRVTFPLPRFRRFAPGRVPVCNCGWPMQPEELDDGTPSVTTFYCARTVPGHSDARDIYPAAFGPLHGCPPCPLCGEPEDVDIWPNSDGSGWHFNCSACGRSFPVVGPVGDPAPVDPRRAMTGRVA